MFKEKDSYLGKSSVNLWQSSQFIYLIADNVQIMEIELLWTLPHSKTWLINLLLNGTQVSFPSHSELRSQTSIVRMHLQDHHFWFLAHDYIHYSKSQSYLATLLRMNKNLIQTPLKLLTNIGCNADTIFCVVIEKSKSDSLNVGWSVFFFFGDGGTTLHPGY